MSTLSDASTQALPAADTTCLQDEFDAMMGFIGGYSVTSAIYVAAKLGIADLLEQHASRSLVELAESTHTQPDPLYRLLRALCGIGIFQESTPQQFSQTPLSRRLAERTPQSMKHIAIMAGEEHYQVWGHLLESVQTGHRAFEAYYGMPVFQYLQQNPDSGSTFNLAMTGYVSNLYPPVLTQYDFSAFRTLVDVGGGHGALLFNILEQTPQLQGILFDLPHVVASTSVPPALQSRVRLSGGSFFESIDAGADAYLLSHIVHDWDDASTLAILKAIHTAMPPHGTLLVFESLVEADNQFSPAKFLDLTMLLMTEGGRERSLQEYQALFRQAGFIVQQVITAPNGISILEVKKSA